MEQEKADPLYDLFKGSFDTEEPQHGHEQRFLKKLETDTKMVVLKHNKKKLWQKPLAIAASIAIICILSVGIFNSQPSINEQVAEISPEVSKTEFYFANLIDEQVKLLKSESTPETKKIIDDSMLQLKKVEDNYAQLEQDLLKGGNSKMILSAMITNFQIRIALLQDVLEQITTLKEQHEYDAQMNPSTL